MTRLPERCSTRADRPGDEPDAALYARVADSIRHVRHAEPVAARVRKTWWSAQHAVVFGAASVSAWCVVFLASRSSAASIGHTIHLESSVILAATAGLAAAWRFTRIPETFTQ
jgi:hypothetical protein